MTAPSGTNLGTSVPDQQVGIVSVNPANFRATAATRFESYIDIDLRYHVGAVHVIPVVGDQWIVRRYGNNWVLISQLPANTTEMLAVVDNPTQGLTQVGSTNPNAASPTHINGSDIQLNGPAQVNGTLGVGDVLLKDIGGTLQQSTDGGTTFTEITGGGASDIAGIPGLQDELDAKIDKPTTPITPGTHTKITYDANGLVTNGTDADIADITNLQSVLDSKANLGAGGSADPLSTKGDILARTATASVRKAVGANLTVLQADSSQVDGLAWAALSAGQIPGLDVTKIISGIFSGSFIPSLDASKITSGTFLTSLIPGLSASQITSGTFLTGLIPTLDASKIGTGTFLTSLIPTLDASKIGTGVMNLLRIPTMDLTHIPNLPAGQITSGTFLDTLIPNLDTSKITSGVFGLLRIPGLPTSQITSGTFPQSMLNITSIAAGIVSGVLGATNIPSLDATKITSGTLLTSLIPGLPASQITSGQFPQSMITGLSAAIAGADQVLTDAIVTALGGPATGNTSDDVLNFLQNIPGVNIASQLLASVIPALPASQITSGIFGTGLIPSLDAGKITTGIFGTGLIPNLDAGKITTGVMNLLRIPNLPAGQITSGIFGTGLIPNLPASQITSGIFGTGLIPALPASQITSGTFLTSLIPSLDATKITSGTFLTSLIPALDAGTKLTGVLSLLQIPALPASQITTGTLLTSLIPSLPASQITTGVFGAGLIPSLDATKITTGILGLAQIPGLDLTRIPGLPASQITSGTFGTGLIPTLDAAKIGSGVIDLLRLPGMPASQITSGTFPQTMIDNLTTNLGSIFSTITSPVASNLLQNVPVSAIGQFNPELLTNPTYDSSSSVFGGSTGWVWDSTVTHTAGGTGSAKVTANGTILQLLSDPPIPVSPNQVLSVSHWLQWSGVTGSGPSFRLGVQAYLGQGVSNTVDIMTITNPAASSGWQQLSGSYTVPATGVDNIRLQLTVHAAVTAGTVWWDDGSVKKIQLLSESWTSGLPGDISNLFTGINARALITDLTGLQSTLGLGDSSLTAITNRFASLTSGGGFNAAALTNIANIPQLLAASVAGIGGIGNIGASVQQTWDQVAGTGAGAGTLTGIGSRLTNLNTSGLFNAASLSNIINIPLLPQGKIPALDGSIIQFGQIPIGQIPIGNLPTQLNRLTLPDIGQTLDQITNAWVGAPGTTYSATNPTQARQSMDSFYQDFLGLTQKMQDLRSSQTATDVSGTSVTVNFQSMPDGPPPSSFTTTLSGPGTSGWGIKSGAVGWATQVNNGNRTCIAVYNVAPTNTDYQIVRGTLSGAPPGAGSGSMPRIAAIGRVDNPANPRNYVWARGYSDGFLSYKGDLGCTVNGVDTVFVSNVALTWSMDISMNIGVGGNPRRYQVFSGTTLIIDYTESGTTSKFGSGFRYWGCKSELKTDSGSVVAPPSIVGTSVSDNQPPNVVGSTFRAYRANTGTATFSGTNTVPANFFDTQAYCSADMLWDGTNLTVGIDGTYLVNIRYNTPSIPGGAKADVALAQNGGLVRRMGEGFADSSFGANSPAGISGMALVYCHVNDTLTPGYVVTSNSTASGEGTGTATYFEVALVNRSLA